MKPKLMFFGDPHGDLDPMIAAVERFQPEAIVLLGDIQTRRPLHVELRPILDLTEVWFIHGNHDTDSDADYDNLWGSELADRNLHGRIVEIAGFKVAGLGGIFRSKIWDPRRPIEEAAFQSSDAMRRTMKREERWRDGISRKHRSSIFPADYQQLLRSGHSDILVTHEAPAAHPHGWQVIDELAEKLGVQLVVHGHHHRCIDYVGEGLMIPRCHFALSGSTWARTWRGRTMSLGREGLYKTCLTSLLRCSAQRLKHGWTSHTNYSVVNRRRHSPLGAVLRRCGRSSTRFNTAVSYEGWWIWARRFRVILFLDFDGVLHPEGEDHILNGGVDFCFLPRLEALLREFPHVNIVISSSWREQLLYETLLKPFSSDIRARILGATPHSGFGLPPPYGKREGEILAWLQIHDAVDEPWVALDDAYWQFDQCKDHLVL